MPRSTRRALLVTGGALAATLAGCPTRSDSDPGTSDREPGTTPGSSPTTGTRRRTPGPVEPDHPAVRWAYDVVATVRDAPATDGDAVYVGGWRPTDGTPAPGYEPGPAESLSALDATDGTRRWRYRTAAPVQATPTVGDDAVYAVTGRFGLIHGRGFAVAAVAPDGTRRFRFAPGLTYKTLAAVGVAAGRVFVGTSDDALSSTGETLFALDATTGDEEWTADVGDVDGGVARPDAVYVSETDHLSARDPATGQARWRVPAPSYADATVTADAVYVAEDAVRALDPADGTERWRFEPTGRLTATAVVGGSVYAGTDGGSVVALDAADGAERWRATVTGTVGSLQPGGDAVYADDDRAEVVALDAADGAERWRAVRGVDAYVGPVVGDAVVVVGSGGRWLRSLSAADGTERWEFEPVGDPTRPVAAGGRVVVGTDRGLVYALAP